MPKFQPTHLVVVRGEAIPVQIWAVGAMAFYLVEGELEPTPQTFRIAPSVAEGAITRGNGIPIEDSRLAVYG
jgi:hypothetical protein